MRLSKKVIACLLALTVVMTALPIALTTSAAAATGINSTLYYMPTYGEIIVEDSYGASVSFDNNTKFDATIDELIRTSYLTQTNTGITDVTCAGDGDWFIQKWTGTMTLGNADNAGTYTLVGHKIDNGFVMFVNGTKVYEYWGASHWFDGASDRLPYDTSFTVAAGQECEVEIYYLELGGGNALEIFATRDVAGSEGANINDIFDFSLTEERYVIGDNTGEFNALVGSGTGDAGTGNGGNGGQCIEDNWKYDESIDKILAKTVKGEEKVVTSFNGAIIDKECYVVLYDGYLVPAESGTYTFGASAIDNGFYLNIDGTVAYEFWAGNTWNDNGGNTYPTGVALEAGVAYPFTAAFLETNGGQTLDLVASVDGAAATNANMLFTFYTEKPEEIVEEVIPTLAATEDTVLASVDFVNAPVNATVDSAISVNDKGVATFTNNAVTFDSSILSQVNGDLIVEMVIKPAAISNHRIIMSIGDNNVSGQYAVMGMRNEGGIVNALKFNETVSANNALTVGQWVTVKYVIGKAGSAIYVNGELSARAESFDVTALAGTEMKFGQYTVDAWADAAFEGQVSEIRLSTPAEAYVEQIPTLEATNDTVLASVDFVNSPVNAIVDAGVEVADGVATMNDDVITFDSSAIFGAANGSVTIEMVIKPQEFSDHRIIMSVGDDNSTEGDAVQQYAVMGLMGDGRAKLNSAVGSANTLIKGVWSTVKFVMSNEGGQVWVDGVQVGTVNGIDLVSLVGTEMNFGRFTVDAWADAPFVGQVSEIRITTPAVESTPNVVNSGAGMRINKSYGLRFKGTVNAELAETATYGMLILPETMLNGAELTKDTADVLDIEAKVNYGVDAVGNIEYTGVVTSIPEAAFEMNLVARAYVTYTVDGETVTEYAEETDVESYKSVAQKIYDEKYGELSDEVIAELEAILGIAG